MLNHWDRRLSEEPCGQVQAHIKLQHVKLLGPKTQSGTLWPSTGSHKIRLPELRDRLITGLVIDSKTSRTIWSEPNSPRNVLADYQVVLFGGCVNGFDLQLPPQKVDGVEFDVHVRRATGVADIRRCEIRIELCRYCFIIVS